MSFFFLASVSSRTTINTVRVIKSGMNIAFIVEELCLFRISKMSQEALPPFSLPFQPWMIKTIAEKGKFASLKIFFANGLIDTATDYAAQAHVKGEGLIA
jgi:hypothetical protein